MKKLGLAFLLLFGCYLACLLAVISYDAALDILQNHLVMEADNGNTN